MVHSLELRLFPVEFDYNLANFQLICSIFPISHSFVLIFELIKVYSLINMLHCISWYRTIPSYSRMKFNLDHFLQFSIPSTYVYANQISIHPPNINYIITDAKLLRRILKLSCWVCLHKNLHILPFTFAHPHNSGNMTHVTMPLLRHMSR